MVNQSHWKDEGSSIGICLQPKLSSRPCMIKHSKELYGYKYSLVSNVRVLIVSKIIHKRKKHL